MQSYLRAVGLFSVLVAVSIPEDALALEGLSFAHGDWQVVCDNTHTCRAVGYQNQDYQQQGEEPAPVSVIFERAAGANAEIKAKVKFGAISYGAGSSPVQDDTVTLSINDDYQSQLGAELPAYEEMGVSFSGERELTKEQVSQLLNALTMKGRVSIKFNSSAGEEWRLSTTGSTAVLLKMDDYQGLVGTPFGIVKTGPSTANIVQPKQAPVISIPVHAVAGQQLPVTTEADRALANNPEFVVRMKKALNLACDIAPAENGELNLDVARITESQFVVSTLCWSAAYNYGNAVWLVDDNPQIEPKLITESATNYANGTIYEFMLGRGVGDCISAARYIWNGSDFILADSYSTGSCRQIAPGGAWYLPTTVSTVIVGEDPAAGIDCQSEQGDSTEGMAKCALRELASVELKLTDVIESINSLENVTTNDELTAALSHSQDSWLSYRNDVCKVVRLTYAEGTMGLPVMIGCQLDLTEKRLRQLQLTKESLISHDY
ncbi:DUF1176 domain-containing protein [Shewanella sp. Isolate13]|uniref:DUF1176 domain-containing protein n=1 Tax=Shewanella sp. Isolate13 TaxID=2908531 RepID=UPI001EFD163B|nr:DUF1176 domain-containing protein [Shewanella sp. Isolate13]MCG9730873.1 DUF1176 domain-containing protein [Shewanella sp. Isolate13]